MSQQVVLLACRRDEGTLTLSLSSGEVLEVAVDALSAPLPVVGETVPHAVLEQLREGAERKRIARRLFQLLDRRLYSVAALQRKLTEEGFEAWLVGVVLAQFEDKELHSDRQFAVAFCRDTLRRRPVGRRYLQEKLRQQQVSSGVVADVLAELLPSAREVELARQASRQRWSRLQDDTGVANEARVYRFLMARGFPAPVARRAAQEGRRPVEE